MGAAIKVASGFVGTDVEAALEEMIRVAASLKENRRMAVDGVLTDVREYVARQLSMDVSAQQQEQIQVQLEAFKESNLPPRFCKTVFAEARKRGPGYTHYLNFTEDIHKIILGILRSPQLELGIGGFAPSEEWHPGVLSVVR
jgi:hypothetical protein